MENGLNNIKNITKMNSILRGLKLEDFLSIQSPYLVILAQF
jgi:hypothetical protein